MTLKKRLSDLRSKLESGWCKYNMASSSTGMSVLPNATSAVKWCLLGGICSIFDVPSFSQSDEADNLRKYLLLRSELGLLASWNDRSNKREVLNWLDNIIKEVPEDWSIIDGIKAEEAKRDFRAQA